MKQLNRYQLNTIHNTFYDNIPFDIFSYLTLILIIRDIDNTLNETFNNK